MTNFNQLKLREFFDFWKEVKAPTLILSENSKKKLKMQESKPMTIANSFQL